MHREKGGTSALDAMVSMVCPHDDSCSKSADPEVVFEDESLLAVSKPFGMPSQRDKSQDPSLLDWAAAYLGFEPHLLHRLDRPTGGLILLGKTAEATREISRLFQARRVTKVYWAVTESKLDFEEREFSHFIGKLPNKNFVRAYDKKVRHSKPAKVVVRVTAEKGSLCLLNLHPTTGRRHQLRAQLKAIKAPILGDKKYGKGKALQYPGIALWAYSLSLPRKSGELHLCVRPPLVYPWSEFDIDQEMSNCLP